MAATSRLPRPKFPVPEPLLSLRECRSLSGIPTEQIRSQVSAERLARSDLPTEMGTKLAAYLLVRDRSTLNQAIRAGRLKARSESYVDYRGEVRKRNLITLQAVREYAQRLARLDRKAVGE